MKEDKASAGPPLGDREPGDRGIGKLSQRERRERMLDKTIADSFPASDPPSSLPDPDSDPSASFSYDSAA